MVMTGTHYTMLLADMFPKQKSQVIHATLIIHNICFCWSGILVALKQQYSHCLPVLKKHNTHRKALRWQSDLIKSLIVAQGASWNQAYTVRFEPVSDSIFKAVWLTLKLRHSWRSYFVLQFSLKVCWRCLLVCMCVFEKERESKPGLIRLRAACGRETGRER